MGLQSKPRRILLRPVPGPRNSVAWHRPRLLCPGATTPARNLTKLTTPGSRSPAKHWTSAKVPSPRKNSPATPFTPGCPRFALFVLKPIKTSTTLRKIEPSDFTIPRKTLDFRVCEPSGEKILPFCSIGRRQRPFQASCRPNATERHRTEPNTPERAERAERGNTQGSSSRTPNTASHSLDRSGWFVVVD